jgi:hypothetical protein
VRVPLKRPIGYKECFDRIRRATSQTASLETMDPPANNEVRYLVHIKQIEIPVADDRVERRRDP